jgi:hypothetical protein
MIRKLFALTLALSLVLLPSAGWAGQIYNYPNPATNPNFTGKLSLTGYEVITNATGPEKITNGAMGAATGWTLGADWSIGGGVATKAAGGASTLSQASADMVTPLVVGELYRLAYTLDTTVTTGGLTPSAGGWTGTNQTADGTYIEWFRASSTAALTFTPGAAALTCTVNNVSLKKVGTQAADQVTVWVEDQGGTAGRAGLYVRGEDGGVIGLAGEVLTFGGLEGDITLTRSADTLTMAGGSLVLGTGALVVAGGGSFAGLHSTGNLTLAPAARTTAAAVTPYFSVTTPADTAITTTSEAIGVNFATGARAWVDGTVTTQREFVFAAPTYNKTTTAATFTTASTLAITAAPIAGTGVTISNPYALNVQSGASYFGGAATFASTVGSGAITVTSPSATALAVGLAGTTNPAFTVDASTASSATGIKIKSAAVTGGVALSVTTSGTNENLTIDAAGSGTITLGGTSTGAITLSRAATATSVVNPFTTAAESWIGPSSTAGVYFKDGNVGIGATAPTVTLAIGDNATGFVGESAAVIQMGLDSATPVAQTLKGADARAGTDDNTAGGDFTLGTGRGTGTGTPGRGYLNATIKAGGGSGAQTLAEVASYGSPDGVNRGFRYLTDVYSQAGAGAFAVGTVNNSLYRITAAGTTVLPPGTTVGQTVTVVSTTAAVVSVDVDSGSDYIILNGVALAAGNKATSDGTIGAMLSCINEVANYWRCQAGQSVWSDGGS